MLSRTAVRVRFTSIAVATLGLLPALTMATVDPGADVTFPNVINPVTLAAAVVVVGGGFLVAAFGTGGAFRLAKKGFKWLFGYIG